MDGMDRVNGDGNGNRNGNGNGIEVEIEMEIEIEPGQDIFIFQVPQGTFFIPIVVQGLRIAFVVTSYLYYLW